MRSIQEVLDRAGLRVVKINRVPSLVLRVISAGARVSLVEVTGRQRRQRAQREDGRVLQGQAGGGGPS